MALSKPAPVKSALLLRDFQALSARGPHACSVLGVVAFAGEMRVLAQGVPEGSSSGWMSMASGTRERRSVSELTVTVGSAQETKCSYSGLRGLQVPLAVGR